MNKTTVLILSLSALLILLAGCSGREPSYPVPEQPDMTGNAVYYWKTRFELGNPETVFLEENGIKRIYLRYFDVDYERNPVSYEEGIVPVGTVRFVSPRPEGVEIVPTVFITVGALVHIRDNKLVMDAAEKIVRRVLNMSSYNEMGPVLEVQLDCDWTESTQKTYFDLCQAVKHHLQKEGAVVSSTIRLQQLRLPAPPVDRGVLMLYNTGAMRDPSEKNSILNAEDVKLYLRGTPVKYALPLDFAYPTYSWGLWFRDREFMGILHQSDFSDQNRYVPASTEGTFRVCKEHILEGHHLIPGDLIRLETSEMEAIRETAALVTAAFPGTHGNIIYHFDGENLKHYTRDEIKEILCY